MSEEEIIEILKTLISWKSMKVEIRDYEIEAIQGLLDLYNKEKEKNIKLANIIKSLNEEKEYNKELLYEKESVFDKGYLEGTRDGEEEIRDEIREKINKVDELLEDYDKKFTDPLVPYEIRSYYDSLIRVKSVLKELLEESKSNENNI